MGTIQHKSILVTGSNYPTEKKLTKAHTKAKKLFPGLVSEKIKALTNGYESFFIAPCGSKLEWNEAFEHEEAINKYTNYLYSLRHEDGSTSVKFVYVTFGELGFNIEDHS